MEIMVIGNGLPHLRRHLTQIKLISRPLPEFACMTRYLNSRIDGFTLLSSSVDIKLMYQLQTFANIYPGKILAPLSNT